MQKKYRSSSNKGNISKKTTSKTAIALIAVLAAVVLTLAVILVIQLTKTPYEGDPTADVEISPPACTDKTVHTVGDFSYMLLDDGTAMITDCSYDRTVSQLFIPSEIDGKRVTAIGDSAFELMTWLISVDIPEGVTYIGSSSFAFCGMSSVNLPSSLTAIQKDAFNECSYISLAVFNGSSAEWKKVTVGKGNTLLTRQMTFSQNS